MNRLDENAPDTSIKIGDRVRSYDFPDMVGSDHPAGQSYVEGVVSGIIKYGTDPHRFTCDVYVIAATKWVRGGEVLEINEYNKDVVSEHYYPPVNGTPSSMGGVTYGVVRVDA